MTSIRRSADDPDDIELIEEGYFSFRSGKGCPLQPLRIIYESGGWVAILCGEVVHGSGAALAKDVPFLKNRSPFHRITKAIYDRLMDEYDAAPADSPLRRLDEPVNLRATSPFSLYKGR